MVRIVQFVLVLTISVGFSTYDSIASQCLSARINLYEKNLERLQIGDELLINVRTSFEDDSYRMIEARGFSEALYLGMKTTPEGHVIQFVGKNLLEFAMKPTVLEVKIEDVSLRSHVDQSEISMSSFDFARIVELKRQPTRTTCATATTLYCLKTLEAMGLIDDLNFAEKIRDSDFDSELFRRINEEVGSDGHNRKLDSYTRIDWWKDILRIKKIPDQQDSFQELLAESGIESRQTTNLEEAMAHLSEKLPVYISTRVRPSYYGGVDVYSYSTDTGQFEPVGRTQQTAEPARRGAHHAVLAVGSLNLNNPLVEGPFVVALDSGTGVISFWSRQDLAEVKNKFVLIHN